MAVNIKTPGVAHVTLRVTDYKRAKRFYTEILGFQVVMEPFELRCPRSAVCAC